MKRRIGLSHARLEDLPRLHDFIQTACREVGANEDVTYALRLAVEEACTNIIVHGYRGTAPGPIDLSFEANAGQIVVTIADRARPFSPDAIPPPNLGVDWEQRKIGGLGWYLIRKMTDEVQHQPNPGGGNRITLKKKF